MKEYCPHMGQSHCGWWDKIFGETATSLSQTLRPALGEQTDHIWKKSYVSTGWFFYCSVLKMTKCQPLKEILEVFFEKTTKKEKVPELFLPYRRSDSNTLTLLWKFTEGWHLNFLGRTS